MNINLWIAGLSKSVLFFFFSARQEHAGKSHSVHAGFLSEDEKDANKSTELSREKD